MPEWKPEPIWKDQEVFIIGGGSSLRGFDWSLLENEHTIGCNNAFRLGPKVCDICVFCDRQFILKNNTDPRRGFFDKLSVFPNPVISNDNQLRKRKIPWVTCIPRKVKGLGLNDTLGYNKNTGAVAINIALIMGAKTVYLLGFDMCLDNKGRPNWHDDWLLDEPKKSTYKGMITAMDDKAFHRDLNLYFADRNIINVSNVSKLNTFPKVNFDEFWMERKTKCTV